MASARKLNYWAAVGERALELYRNQQMQDWADPDAVADKLKQYRRALPNPWFDMVIK